MFTFEGKRPHYQMDVFESIERVLAWVDGHKEMVWEEPSDAGEDCLLFSRKYVQGSVMDRMAR